MAEIILPTTPKEPLTQDPQFLIIFSKPKNGKTTAGALLKDNLLIDLEEGSDHVGGLTVKANNFEELVKVKSAIVASGHTYDYITLDTATSLEDMSKEFAMQLYKATPQGKSCNLDDIIKLPQGAGYMWLREAFLKIIDGFKPLAKKCLILFGHVNDKMINKDGEEVSEMSLDLSGKLARIVYSRADAVGLMYRKKDQVFVNFNGGGDSIIEARPKHLAGKEILLTEKIDDNIVAHWDKIFLELNK